MEQVSNIERITTALMILLLGILGYLAIESIIAIDIKDILSQSVMAYIFLLIATFIFSPSVGVSAKYCHRVVTIVAKHDNIGRAIFLVFMTFMNKRLYSISIMLAIIFEIVVGILIMKSFDFMIFSNGFTILSAIIISFAFLVRTDTLFIKQRMTKENHGAMAYKRLNYCMLLGILFATVFYHFVN